MKCDAETVYSWIRDLPVIDWHNHLDPAMLAADRPLGSLYEVWVKPDPYKHRAMRICGVPERLITSLGQRTSSSVENALGQRTSSSVDDSDESEKWRAWMSTLPKLVGNPLYVWSQQELAFLGLDPEPYLHGQGENVSLSQWTPSKLLRKFNVAWMSPCITPADLPRWDNGRPRPLNWSPAEVHTFPLACETPSSHFSHSLLSGDAHNRNLPHIGQDATLVFVTFRLVDSLPAGELAVLEDEKQEWLRAHPEPWSAETQREYIQEIGERIDTWLDAGHGDCILADARCRAIVEECLEYFNGERSTDGDVRCPRYILHSYVVMPNHVHVLFELLKGAELSRVIQGWKSVSARRINAELGTQGPVWKEEYYDRLIRDAGHYKNTLKYIEKNGETAKCLSKRKATDEDVRCPSAAGAQTGRTDVPVRSPQVVPSLRINAGEYVPLETLERFDAAGCRIVDVSVDDTSLLASEFDLLRPIAAFAAAHGWTMLLHIGALRSTSSRLRRVAGPAGGFAGMAAPCDPDDVARFLNRLESAGFATDEDVRCPSGAGSATDEDVRCPSELPRTILLTLNPEAHAQLAILSGSFVGEGMPGKVQLGPAWWWCDHREGIFDVFEKNAAYGVLSTFIGMTTDSRSLLSFVRHDYFRRLLARWIAAKVADGDFPDDAELLRSLCENIAYRNAHDFIVK